jgi:hypothetical protein
METALQTIDRLLGALETLAGNERFLLDSGAYEEALAVQIREEPVVARLAELLLQPGIAANLTDGVQARAQALLTAQAAMSKRLALKRSALQQDLQALRNAQTRLHQLRPAYGHNEAHSSFAGQA